MKSLLKEIESKFIELEESLDAVDHEDADIDNDGDTDKSDEYLHHRRNVRKKAILQDEEELDEMSATGAVAGYNIPAAFAKPGKWRNKSKTYESVNTPPSFRWKDETPQRPESDEEVFNDKFPFASNENYWWQSDNNEYPTKFYADGMGTNSIKDKTTRKGNLPNTATPIRKPKNEYIQVQEAMDSKYEQLIESYRAYATGDAKSTPEQKIKHTIKEVARQLQEIEKTINYASRLKTESGVARNGYGNSVESALNKISERLIKISERVRALGE